MAIFINSDGKPVLMEMVNAVQDNKSYLGDIDGLIGDGDHGMNMNKGFSVFENRFSDKDFGFTEGLKNLSEILMNEIGGSMGPIYGVLLRGMGEAGEDLKEITLKNMANMLKNGLDELCDIVDAKVGDKTLIDTLLPAVNSLMESANNNEDFILALDKMKKEAKKGRDSTKDLVAKFGRSSRLGERSRGVLDAGATSCCIILCAMADGIKSKIRD